jgi:hypothetical protein
LNKIVLFLIRFGLLQKRRCCRVKRILIFIFKTFCQFPYKISNSSGAKCNIYQIAKKKNYLAFLDVTKTFKNLGFYFFFLIYLMQTSTEIVLQLIISYKICSNKNKNKITWSTGPKKTIRMTKSPLTRHGILLQTPMTEGYLKYALFNIIDPTFILHSLQK